MKGDLPVKSATRITARAIGVLAALAGLEHGIGEMLQGNVAPPGLVIQSWPNSAFFSILNGEPAMTVIPNLLLSGIATVVIALGLMALLFRGLDARYGPLVLVVLAVALLLVGGGFGPPLICLLLAACVGVVRHVERRRSSSRAAAAAGRLRAGLWPWFLGLCVGSFLMLCPGVNILNYFFGVDATALIIVFFFSALISMGLSFWSGLAHDRLNEQSVTATPQ